MPPAGWPHKKATARTTDCGLPSMSLWLGLARNLGVTRSSAAPGQSGALLQTECCLAVTTTPATRYSPATQCFWALPGHPPAQISTVFLACPRSKRAELCCRSSRQLLRSFQRADGFPDPWPVCVARQVALASTNCGLTTLSSPSIASRCCRSRASGSCGPSWCDWWSVLSQ